MLGGKSSSMKVLVAVLLVLLCTSTLCACAEEDRSYEPSTCCSSYVSRKIPRKNVVSFYRIGGVCASAIIFVTKAGQHICANPNESWVQGYIRDLEDNS